MTEKDPQDSKSPPAKSKPDRDERLAAELRANLKKRKNLMRETRKIKNDQ